MKLAVGERYFMVVALPMLVLLVFLLFKGFGGDPAEILGGLNASVAGTFGVQQRSDQQAITSAQQRALTISLASPAAAAASGRPKTGTAR